MSRRNINLIELDKFLKKEFITVKKKEVTFFDIAGYPHYENVISNVYAYLLDPSQNHCLGTLFIDSLQELIETKFNFSKPVINREYSTRKGGRIDIVIHEELKSDEKEELIQCAIIIENKIYHSVVNNLNDYFETFTTAVKKGVLLTIRPVSVKHAGFVNITHEQWLEQVFKNLGNLILKLPERVIYILKELTLNLKNFNLSHEINDYFSFYRSHLQQMTDIETLKSEVNNHIWTQVIGVQDRLDGVFKSYPKKSWKLCYYKASDSHAVFFTVFPKLLDITKPQIEIVIELSERGIEKLDQINSIPFSELEKALFKETVKQDKKYLHYASTTLNVQSIADLGQQIEHTIKEGSALWSMYVKIEKMIV